MSIHRLVTYIRVNLYKIIVSGIVTVLFITCEIVLPSPVEEEGDSETVTIPNINILPRGGVRHAAKTVMISTTTPEANIRYTIDGSEPTASSPLFAEPMQLGSLGAGEKTIRAIGIRAGFVPSAIAWKTFTVPLPSVIFDPPGGNMINRNEVTINSDIEGAEIYYTTDGSEPTTSSSRRATSPLSLSVDASRAGERTIKAISILGGLSSGSMSATFNIAEAVATPTFNPTGGYVASRDRLIINTDTAAASIYYTTDGSVPTRESREYRGPLRLGSIGTGNRTIRAIAVLDGYNDSTAASAIFIIADERDVDVDNNGLIEIRSLEMLNNIRYNLAGTSYDDDEDDSSDNSGNSFGANTNRPAICQGRITDTNLCGYELTQDLDFAIAAHYEEENVDLNWRPTSSGIIINPDNARNSGFPGIGAETGGADGFTAIFEGNSYIINNLYSRSSNTDYRNAGLFRLVESSGIIRNVGVTNANVYGGIGLNDKVGSLVGWNNGTISASHASGDPQGERGTTDRVGGLVGRNGGTIVASYATGNPDGGAGENDSVGGLVGINIGGTIIASYTTGNPNDAGGGSSSLGGLVGWNNGGTIAASYASGNATAGSEGDDYVGGLVGYNSNNEGNTGTIKASYATGDSNGGSGLRDRVGNLVGSNIGGTVTSSYAFGNSSNGIGGHNGSPIPEGVNRPADLSAGNVPTIWNNSSENTRGAWNFGTAEQNPALVYADYDGTGSGTDYCSTYPAKIPGSAIDLICGTRNASLVGGSTAQNR